MPQQLRMGVIGCGAIAQIMHIPYMVDYDELFKIVAISDAYAPVLNAVGNHYNISNRYSDWRDMLTRDDIDAVIVAHSGSHRDSIIGAVEAGKHVMTEKPLAWNLREAREVSEVVANHDRIVQMAYHKRYDPSYQLAKEEVAKIDNLGFVRITVLHPANELGFSPHRIRRGKGVIDEGHIDPGSWDGQLQGQLKAFAGGELAPLVDEALKERKDDPRLRLAYGIVTISLIHQIYMLEGFLGMPEQVVSADVWRDGFSIHIALEYSDHLRCTLDWHFLPHLKDYQEEYLFCGNNQRVTLTFPGPYYRNFPSPIIIQGGDGELTWKKEIIVSLDEAFRNELLAFHDAVVNNEQPQTTVADGIKHMQLIQAIADKMH